jgi:hypothetical protein
MQIKVNNLESPRTGNPVANQYEIETDKYYIFQSYNTIIAKKERGFLGKVILDANSWNYSRTTLKYLKQFKDNTKPIEKSILFLIGLETINSKRKYFLALI